MSNCYFVFTFEPKKCLSAVLVAICVIAISFFFVHFENEILHKKKRLIYIFRELIKKDCLLFIILPAFLRYTLHSRPPSSEQLHSPLPPFPPFGFCFDFFVFIL